MNCMSDHLYKAYMSAKELWEVLDMKYQREDASSKKYIVSHFLEFKMVDKTMQNLVHELLLVCHEVDAEDMQISSSFGVAAMTEKLLHSWKDFKNRLKHKTTEMSLTNMQKKLKSEEENRGADKRLKLTSERANVVKHDGSCKKQKSSKKLGPKRNPSRSKSPG